MFSKAYSSEIRQYFDDQMVLLNGRVEELKEKEAEIAETDRNLCRFSRKLLERKIEEISSMMAQCTEDEAEALQFIYSAMPLSDLLNYPVTVYLTYAKHGVFLWKEGPFAGKVPEKLFANYVLHYRAHNEDITDTRKFFYDRLRERTAHKSMYEAAVETNYWCAEKATYQTTFMRTQNPLTMYGTAAGRCGEEAPFAVTALRSIGIPARGVSAPWWAHCDDNHAWVEAWCDGEWHFLGGCEPEKKLDKGWFEGPASRAMMIESRWFGKDTPEEQVTGRPDMSARLNHLGLYAETRELMIKVTDEEGNPVPGAKVEFSVLNYARFNSVASLYTGKEEGSPDYGRVKIDTGYGDFLVCAYEDGYYGETHVSLADVRKAENRDLQDREAADAEETHCIETPDQKRNYVTKNSNSKSDSKEMKEDSGSEYTVVLRKEMPEPGQWRDMDFHAPRGAIQDERKTEEEAGAEKEALERAAGSRQRRIENFYQKEAAERTLIRFSEEDRKTLDELLHQARGNMGEIVRFLEWDFAGKVPELEKRYGQEHWKVEALNTLQPNDLWDIRAEVLAECSICASPYAEEFPRDIFFNELLNPCAMFEFPRACRETLKGIFSERQKEEIRKAPGCLPEKLDSFLITLPKQEYANLITGPVGCLTGGMGNEISRAVLCVQIYRALGIPARMRPMDRTMECYVDGTFVPVTSREEENTGILILESGESLKLEDRKHYSLSRFENGRFMPLFLGRERKKPETEAVRKSQLETEEKTETEMAQEQGRGETAKPDEAAEERERRLELEEGRYRIVTTNRLPNGDQVVKILDIDLSNGEEKRVTLQMRGISQEALLNKMPVDDITLHTAEGKELMLSSLSEGKKALILWLELTREPTEHILNEMYEKHELFQKLTAPIYFVLRRGENGTRDQTLLKTCGVLPGAKLLFHDFGEAYGKLSCQVGRNPGKLPLALIMENGSQCIFSDSGYNVGMADMLLGILA